jgi:AcrR family transcriptional regulator
LTRPGALGYKGPYRSIDRKGMTDTRTQIRQAALARFVHHGFAATGIRDIAAAAGLTTASLYHYIGTKDDLLVDIMTEITGSLMERAGRALAAIDRPDERLAVLVQLHVWVHGARRMSAIVADTELRALSGKRREQVLAQRDRYEGLWRGILEDGVKAGVFMLEEPKVATFALLEMCTGVSHWYSDRGPVPLERICRLYADWALALTRASRGGRPVRVADLPLFSPADHYPVDQPERPASRSRRSAAAGRRP